jgi:hypothetical protein
MCRSSVLGIFQARFRMQLYRAGYLKYDSGHNLFPVEDMFHVDIEQISEGLIVFGIAPGKIVFPRSNMMTVHSLMKVKRIFGWDL